MATDIPLEVTRLVKTRSRLRQASKYNEADQIRNEILNLGYEVKDSDLGSELIKISADPEFPQKPGLLAIFGSGEVSSTGQKIHEYLVKQFIQPINIALLETPTGFEDNPHIWYIKMGEYLTTCLYNHHPQISRIAALTNSENSGTNYASILKPLASAHYIHTGAGSPTYALKHLKSSLALAMIIKQFEKGAALSLASAAAVAAGKFCLPVYEIYFAGHDPIWENGLDIFSQWGLNLTIIPHWNNTEGGKDINTNFCYMGEKRFLKLLKLLPQPTTILGIDEHTAVIIDIKQQNLCVMGKGAAHLYGDQIIDYPNGTTIPFAQVSRMCYFPK
jgi:hypothetical protein